MKKEIYDKAQQLQSKIRSANEMLRLIKNNFNLNLGGQNDGLITLSIHSNFLKFNDPRIDNNFLIKNIIDGNTQQAIYNLLVENITLRIDNYEREFESL